MNESNSPTSQTTTHPPHKRLKRFALFCLVCSVIVAGVWVYWRTHYIYYGIRSMPLAMTGGDPYIRARMRTISASEANSEHPYTLLYGGDQFIGLNRHPNICTGIETQVNKGNCTTAAGRYQILTSTWEEKSAKYSPRPRWQKMIGLDFSPKNQDKIVYLWLSDKKAWNMDISKRLQQDDLNSVLRRLSSTWTSLGYGIESNSNTILLPKVYAMILKEELKQAQQPNQVKNNQDR